MQQLEDFTNSHFLAEQLLMRLHAYPAFETHQQEHDGLITELRDLRRRIESGDDSEPAVAVEALEQWLLTHMHTADEDLAIYLKQASESETPKQD